jgi:hypothetical protein
MRKLLPFLLIFTLSIANVFSQTCITPTGGTINGSSVGCADRVETYTVSGVSNATDYIWAATSGASLTKISNTEYSVVFNAASTVTITVTPTNGACNGSVIIKSVSVSGSPAKPVISQTGNVLNTAASASYQWYNSSTKITGATNQTYTPTTNGQYYVQVTNAGGCSYFSDAFSFTLTAIKEDSRFDGLTFYPNPVINSIHIKFPKRFDVNFYDISGRKAIEKLNLEGETEIDLSTLIRGIYIMRVSSEGKYATRKIILQ